MTNILFYIIGGSVIMAAVLVFAALQHYMNDPGRKQFNQWWYAQFQDSVDRAYARGGISWRDKGLAETFYKGYVAPF
jgi:hypothetical protein